MTNNATLIQPPHRDNSDRPALSVVVPVHNEEKNIVLLAEEISAVLQGNLTYEIVYVDDGSSDNSHKVLEDLTSTLTSFRAIQHLYRCGQSAAIYSGVLAASAPLVLTLDGDGQNDPTDIPLILETYYTHADEDGRLLVSGWRKRRNDSWDKRFSSRIANTLRSGLLSDKTPDTGCGLKVFRREDFLVLPTFDHMHRFLPALMLHAGARVMSVEVIHRPRLHGKSNYGLFDRLWVGIIDIFGVTWLYRRRIKVEFREIGAASNGTGPT